MWSSLREVFYNILRGERTCELPENRWSQPPIELATAEESSVLLAYQVGIGYSMEGDCWKGIGVMGAGVSHLSRDFTHSLDETQQQKLLLHVCIL
ncbi:hypothetical protein EVAR_5332_1 [Eumeta japonica]|uniref:Uncharacterized protein n=1 Tax=Eumeta variegata TaxID=151549 RepID=A0A4C1TNX7_EUMVA|nr:hypothetical protein EVAR_5332_1 [Eumeta japonica]